MGYLRIYPPKGKTLDDLPPKLRALAEEQNALADEFERQEFRNVEAHDAIKRNAER